MLTELMTTLQPAEKGIFTIIGDIVSAIIGLIPVGIFLSGALAVVLSYLFGRRLLRWLLRFFTRRQTLYFVVQSDMMTDIGARLGELLRANGVLLHAMEAVPTWGTGPALIQARVKLGSRFRTRSTLSRLGHGAMAVAGVQDFYMEG